MEKSEGKTIVVSSPDKKEIDWAYYLDFTRFYEPGEINNLGQELFKKDFEEI
ncbi:MAG: hypothetical protein ACFFHD_10345 [Promethearchaeota archaeon]